MPEPDYQGFAQYTNALLSPQTLAANVNSLNQIQLQGAQTAAGAQIAAGNYLGGANTLYSSGDIKDAQQEQAFGGTAAGASALAGRNYAGAASAFGSAGDAAGVQNAQQAQFQQYQVLGTYLQQASPILKAAYAQNGPAGLTHAVGLTTQELVQAGLMAPAQSAQYVQQAGSDPQGLLSSVDNFVQQVQYQKLGDNSLLGTNAAGRPMNIVSGPKQTTLTNAGGSETLVATPGSVTPVGANGATAPAPQPAPAPSAAPSGGPATANPSLPAPATPVAAAIFQQESGGNPNAPTSVDGAVGGMQITPATFKQYAKPGEDINNPVDNMNVGNRIATALQQQYPGDPARQAVGFFSGPQNISPAGSPVPWLNNTKDGNGQTVSGYVGGVLSKLGNVPAAAAPPTAASTSSAPGATVLASTATNGPLWRPATPAELPSGAVSASYNTATGQISNVINASEVNNLTPAALKQLGDQAWLTGTIPDFGRGAGGAVAKEQIANYVAQKSAQMGLSGSDDNLRHATVSAAQTTLQKLIPQQAQLATAENNAIDNANQIRTLLPTAAAKYNLRTLNDVQQAVKRYTNDPQLAALDTAYKDFTGDYSKVMFSNATGNGGAGGVSDRESTTEHFTPDDPIPVALAKLNQAQIGMRYRTAEYGATIQRMNEIARTGVVPPSSAAQPITGDQSGAPSAPAAPTTQQPSGPPPGAVQYLVQNPNLAAQFDAKYGPGASASILKAQQPAQPQPPGQQAATQYLSAP